MKYLAVDKKDFWNRTRACAGVCGAISNAASETRADYFSSGPHKKWLLNNGRGRQTKFYFGTFWLPILTPESYTARIMLLELGALMSEEEGN